MIKGHNQEINNEKQPDSKGKGEHKKQTNKEREKTEGKGRNVDPDPGDDRKGKNNV